MPGPGFDIRFHGRGGQGTVVAAKIVADAVARSGRASCQAIPEFGVERRGAPVTAYLRVCQRTARERSRVYAPDVVVLLDPGIAALVSVTRGLKAGGLLLVNTEKGLSSLPAEWSAFRTLAVPAREIALRWKLGSEAAPLVNTPMAGALCAVLELADADSLTQAVAEGVPVRVQENVSAALEAFAFGKKEAPYAPA